MAAPRPRPVGRQARLPDLIGLGRLFLLAFGFWTLTAVVFALQYAAWARWRRAPACRRRSSARRDGARELVALRAAHAAGRGGARSGSAAPGLPRARALLLHAGGAACCS